MKILKLMKLLSFLFVLALMVVSCSKDPLTEEETIKGEIVPTEEIDQNSLFTRSVTNEDGLDLDCFVILYPFDLIDNEGNTYTITGIEDYDEIFDETNETFVVDFVYPLDIENEDGTTSTIADAEELGEAFANCLPNDWNENAFPAYLINAENSCLTLLYPVSVTDFDGETTTFDDEASFVAALAEEPLFFVFPLSFIDQEGNIIEVNDVEALLTALFDCNSLEIDSTIWNDDSGFDYIGCYEIVFPFGVILEDGTTVEVNDHMEYCDLLLTGNIQGFAFPLSLTNEEGEIVIVGSEEELAALMEECFDWEGPGEIEGELLFLYLGAVELDGCFVISFPISAQSIDLEGNIETITINNLDELSTLSSSLEFTLYSVIYPITITVSSTGEVIELKNFEELISLIATCQ